MNNSKSKFFLPIKEKFSELRKKLELEPAKPFRLLLAVSGGADSVCLLFALNELREECNLELAVAHFDHALRLGSAKEAEFVESLAGNLELPFFSKRAEDSPQTENLEAWARRSRYQFLQDSLASWNGDLILTAHHQNDQAETLLFRLLSGRLMRDAHCIAAFDAQKKIARPLLDISKKAIEEFVSENRLFYVHDASNDDLSRTRNRIRHELLPDLESSFNPSLVSSLGELSKRLSTDEDYLWQAAQQTLQGLPADLRVWNLQGLEPSMLWRVLLLVARAHLAQDAGKLGYHNLQTAIKMICSKDYKGNFLDLGAGISLAFESSGKLKFYRTSEISKKSEKF